jgi:transposase-like protein
MPSPASPNTSQYRCDSCGRYFDDRATLAAHEAECRLAKMTTETGRKELEREEHAEHVPNDADIREFQHGTKR